MHVLLFLFSLSSFIIPHIVFGILFLFRMLHFISHTHSLLPTYLLIYLSIRTFVYVSMCLFFHLPAFISRIRQSSTSNERGQGKTRPTNTPRSIHSSLHAWRFFVYEKPSHPFRSHVPTRHPRAHVQAEVKHRHVKHS